MKSIWDEIDAMGLNTTCSCSCTCGATLKRMKFQEDQRVVKFLMGLNDSYNVIRGTILMQNPLPSLAIVYNLLVQEERQREINHQGEFQTDSASFHARNSKLFYPKQLPSRDMNFKGQYPPCQGHYASNQGKFSPNQEQYTSNQQYSSNSSRKTEFKGSHDGNKTKWCNYCKKPGHTINICKRLEYNNRKRFANAAEGPDFGQGSEFAGSSSFQNPADITPEMYNQFHHAMQHNQPTDNTTVSANFAGNTSFSNMSSTCFNSWILDSGASDHMCGNKNLFSILKTVPLPYSISLPNGEHAIINAMGEVPISSDIVLKNVLYVPSFRFNLLSISRLLKQLNKAISFTPEFCCLQGSSMKMPLILGKQHRNLYFLKSNSLTTTTTTMFSSSNSVIFSDSAEIWHSRLGHLPLYKLKNFPFCKISAINENKIHTCSICAKARQHRFSFPDSSIQTTKPF
ncbi:uncharacterized protein LOC141587809 [Silene latifolia]|uniref:uncharacterized protein LOC141587809 n=1 Tax=Silene latifolia TaxID=37657 RepID=UPI003D78112C